MLLLLVCACARVRVCACAHGFGVSRACLLRMCVCVCVRAVTIHHPPGQPRLWPIDVQESRMLAVKLPVRLSWMGCGRWCAVPRATLPPAHTFCMQRHHVPGSLTHVLLPCMGCRSNTPEHAKHPCCRETVARAPHLHTALAHAAHVQWQGSQHDGDVHARHRNRCTSQVVRR